MFKIQFYWNSLVQLFLQLWKTLSNRGISICCTILLIIQSVALFGQNDFNIQYILPMDAAERIGICGDERTHSIRVENISGVDLFDVEAELNLPVGVFYVAGSIVNAGELNTTPPMFSLGDMPVGNVITISYDLDAGCDGISLATGSADIFYTTDFSYTGGNTQSLGNASTRFEVIKPTLSFPNIIGNASGSNVFDAVLGEIDTLKVDVVNGNSGALRELYYCVYDGHPTLSLNSIWIDTTNIPVTYTSIGGDSLYFLIDQDDINHAISLDPMNDDPDLFQFNETMRICEVWETVSCPTGSAPDIERSAFYGCDGVERCESTSTSYSGVRYGFLKPLLVANDYYHSYAYDIPMRERPWYSDCYRNPTEPLYFEYAFINDGAAPLHLNDFIIQLHAGQYEYIPWDFDPTSVELYFKNDTTITPGPAITVDSLVYNSNASYITYCHDGNNNAIKEFGHKNENIIIPIGDTLIYKVEFFYDNVDCGTCSDQYSQFSWPYLQAEEIVYGDACGITEYSDVNGGVMPRLRNYQRVLAEGPSNAFPGVPLTTCFTYTAGENYFFNYACPNNGDPQAGDSYDSDRYHINSPNAWNEIWYIIPESLDWTGTDGDLTSPDACLTDAQGDAYPIFEIDYTDHNAGPDTVKVRYQGSGAVCFDWLTNPKYKVSTIVDCNEGAPFCDKTVSLKQEKYYVTECGTDSLMCFEEIDVPRNWTITIQNCTCGPCEGIVFTYVDFARQTFGVGDINNDGIIDGDVLDTSLINQLRFTVGDTIKATYGGWVNLTTMSNFEYAYGTVNIPIVGTWGNEGVTPLKAEFTVWDASNGNTPYVCDLVQMFPDGQKVVANISTQSLINLGCNGMPTDFVYEQDDSVSLEIYFRVKDYENATQVINFGSEFYATNQPYDLGTKYQCNTLQQSMNFIGYEGYNDWVYRNIAGCNDGRDNNSNNNNVPAGVTASDVHRTIIRLGSAGFDEFPNEIRQVAIPTSQIFVNNSDLEWGQNFQVSLLDANGHLSPDGGYLAWENFSIDMSTSSCFVVTATTVTVDYECLFAQIEYDRFDEGLYLYSTPELNPTCFSEYEAPFTYKDVDAYTNWDVEESIFCQPTIEMEDEYAAQNDGILEPWNNNQINDWIVGETTLAGHDYVYLSSLPNIELMPITFNNLLLQEEACFEVTVENRGDASADNAFFTFESLSGGVVFQSVIDNATGMELVNNVGVIELGAMDPGEFKSLSLCVTSNNCQPDSIVINSGWDCSGYPGSPDEIQCASPTILYLDIPESELGMVVLEPNPNTDYVVDLCSEMEYVVQLNSADVGAIHDINFRFRLPTGHDMVPNSFEILYPVPITGTPNWVTSPTQPTQLGGASGSSYHMVIDPNDPIIADNGLVGTTDLTMNKLQVRFKTFIGCGAISGSRARFLSWAYDPCDKLANYKISPGPTIKINGISDSYISDLTIPTTSALNACTNNSIPIDIEFSLEVGSQDIGPSDSLMVQLPAGIMYETGSYVPGPNAEPASATNPVIEMQGLGQVIIFDLKDGVGPGQSVDLTFNIFADDVAQECIDYEIVVSTFNTTALECGVGTGVFCDVRNISDQVTSNIPVVKPDLSVKNLMLSSTALPPDMEQVDYCMDIMNIGEPIAAGTTTSIELYDDANDNGDIDFGVDVLIGTINTTDAIPSGGTTTICGTLTVPSGMTCNVIAVINPEITCSCNLNSSFRATSELDIPFPQNEWEVCSDDLIPSVGPPALDSVSYTWVGINGASTVSFDSLTTTPTSFQFRNTTGSTIVWEYMLRSVRNDDCATLDTIKITIFPEEYEEVNLQACPFDAFSLNGPIGNSNYQWSPILGLDSPNAAVTDVDASVLTPGIYVYTLSYTDQNGCPGEYITNVTIVPCAPTYVGNYLWCDDNNNGIQDDGLPVEGITVNLYTGTNTTSPIATTTTDAMGHYLFGPIPQAEYIIGFDLPSNYLVAMKDIGNDALDSDLNPDFFTSAFFLSAGDSLITIDAGVLCPEVDLELTKEVFSDMSETPIDAVEVGSTVWWKVEVCNVTLAAPAVNFDALGVVVQDTLPPGLTYVSDDATQGAYDDVTGLWTVGEIINGECEVLWIESEVTSNILPNCNVSQVFAQDDPDIDSAPVNDNGDQSEDDEAKAYISPGADLSLLKIVNNNPVEVGQNISFTIAVTNNGPLAATNVVVSDTIPECLTYSSNNGGTTGSVDDLNSPIIDWNIPLINPNETVFLQITGVADSVGDCCNYAQVTASDQHDIDSDENNDDGDQSEDDEDKANFEILDIPEFTLDKSLVSINQTDAYDWDVTYEIEVCNIGGANGIYDLFDETDFDDDIIINSAAVATNAPLNSNNPGPTSLVGSGPWTFADDQLINFDSCQVYTLVVNVTMNLGIDDGIGNELYTACGDNGGSGPVAGEGLFNMATLDERNTGVIDKTDSACGDLPFVHHSKEVISFTPMANGNHVVVYEICVNNDGGAAGNYDLYDEPQFDDDISIVSASFSCATGESGALAATVPSGGWQLINDATISAGVEQCCTLTIIVNIDTAPGSGGDNVVDECGSGTPGVLSPGEALYNESSLDLNNDGTADEQEEACQDVFEINHEKSIVSIDQTGHNSWCVNYSIVVMNDGNASGYYDLYDLPQFDDDIVITSSNYSSDVHASTSLPLVIPATGWQLGDDEIIADGGMHTYSLQVCVTLDLEDNEVGNDSYTNCGTGGSSDGMPGEGLYNESYLDTNNDGVMEEIDEVCGDLPYLILTKEATDLTQTGPRSWDITYAIVVCNIGGVSTDYDVSDQPCFDDDVVINSADYSSDIAGHSSSPGPINLTGVGPWALNDDQNINASECHSYTFVLNVTLDLTSETPLGDGVYAECATVDMNDCIVEAMPTPVGSVGANTFDGEGYKMTFLGNTGGTPNTWAGPYSFSIESPAAQGGASASTNGFDGNGSNANPNAFLIEFDNLIGAFSATTLDLESDSNFTSGELILYDASFNILDSDPIIYPTGQDGDGESHTIDFTRAANDVKYISITVGANASMPNVNLNRLAIGDIVFNTCVDRAVSETANLYNKTLVDDTDDSTPDIQDGYCQDLPSISHSKELTGITQTGATSWTVSYEIEVVNGGGLSGTYDLSDAIGYEDDVMVSCASYTSDATGNVGNTDLLAVSATGPWTLADDQNIAAGDTQTYVLAVCVNMDLNNVTTTGDGVYTACGTGGNASGSIGEGLYNQSRLDLNNDGTADETDEACGDLPHIYHDKAVLSFTPMANGNHEVVYEICVNNDGGVVGDYDLYDEPQFDDDISIVSASYSCATGESGALAAMVPSGGWQLIDDASIAAGAEQCCTLTIIVNVDIAPGSGGDNVISECGSGTPGDPSAGEALYNESSLDLNNDGTADEMEEACQDVFEINHEKSIVSIDQTGHNAWCINYNIEVNNTGNANGYYDLYDLPQFDDDIVISAATYNSDVHASTVLPLAIPGAGWQLGDDILLASSGMHNYSLQICVEIDLEDAVVGDDSYTGCGVGGGTDGEPGEGLYNESYLDTNNDGTIEETDEVCGDIPYLNLSKSIVGLVQTGPKSWDVTYEIEVCNEGGAVGSYDLSDQPCYDDDVVIDGASYVSDVMGHSSNSGSISLAGNGPWDLNDNQSIVTGGCHKYSLVVSVTMDLTLSSPVGDGMYSKCIDVDPGDATSKGGMYNKTMLDDNEDGVDDLQSEACQDFPSISHTKSLSSIVQTGATSWTVSYEIEVVNSGGLNGTYDLDDSIGFEDDIAVSCASYTSDATGNAGNADLLAISATGPWTLANDQNIAAGDTQTYVLAVCVNMDLNSITTPGDGIYTACGAGGGADGSIGEGLYNESSLDLNNDGTSEETDEACGDLPHIYHDKTALSFTPMANGNHEVVYEICVNNDGGAVGDYDLYDEPQFDDDISIVSASYSCATGESGALAAMIPDGGWQLIDDVSIAAGAEQCCTLTIIVNINTAPGSDGDNVISECGSVTPGDPSAGEALYNESSLDLNNDGTADEMEEACQDVFEISHEKSIVSIDQTGHNTWCVNYNIEVTNTGNADGYYDLYDLPQFDDDIIITGATYSSDVHASTVLPLSIPGAGWQLGDDILLASSDMQTYSLQICVEIDLEDGLVGDDVYTSCGAGGGTDGEPGEGLYNESYLDTNNDGTIEEADEVCGDIPYLNLSKSVAGLVQTGPRSWDVTYEIEICNEGGAVGSYDLSDQPCYDNDVVIDGASYVSDVMGHSSSTGSISLAGNGPWDLNDDQGIATGGCHLYTLVVSISMDLTQSTPVGDGQYTSCGGVDPNDATSKGGLYNKTMLDDNEDGINDIQSEACQDLPSISHTKILNGIVQTAATSWTVSYEIEVVNSGGLEGSYDLSDAIGFEDDIIVNCASYTSDASGNTGNADLYALSATGPWTLADDQNIAAGDTQTYVLAVCVNMDLNSGTSPGDGIYTACGIGGNAAGSIGEGLYNQSSLDLNNDGTSEETDEACGDLPHIYHDKSVISFTQMSSGNHEVVYKICVNNDGGAVGTYDLYDEPQFDDDISIVSSSYSCATGENDAFAATVPAGGWQLVDDATIAVGVEQCCTVTIIVNINTEPGSGGDNIVSACGSTNGTTPEAGEALYNESGLDTNNDGVQDENEDACIDVPHVTHTKDFVDVVHNIDGTYTANFKVTVVNSGSAVGIYDLNDHPQFDNDFVINSAEYNTDAVGHVANPAPIALVGTGPWTLSTNQAIDAGVTQCYNLSVNVSINLSDPNSVGDEIYTWCGTANGVNDPEPGEGLYNQSTLETTGDGIPDEVEETCGDVEIFDLAIMKTVNSTTVQPIVPGAIVTFDLEVFNQGNIEAYEVQLSDYIPSGLSISDGGWSTIGDTAHLVNPITSIAPGASSIVTISFEVDSDFMLTAIINNVEIESAEDVDGNNPPDRDSNPGDENGTTPDDDDNDTEETNGDDDYDPEEITIMQTFDLALVKNLSSSTVTPIVPGGYVVYEIEVFNQGNLDAYNIQVSDYVPQGLSLSNANWSMTGDTANLNMPIPVISAGESEVVLVSFFVDSDFMGTSITNNAEIESQDDIDGPREDDDSESGDEDGSMPDDEDDDIDETNGDDDYDPETISIEQTFDLALVKTLNSSTTMPIVPGVTVIFDLEVFNQGTLDAYNIQLSDYVPEGLTLAGGNGWRMVGDTARLDTPIARVDAGESEIVMISFTVDSDYMLTSIQNNSEIESQEDINGPRDDDDSEAGDEDGSLPDTEDNDIDETNGDDDYDPEVITIMQTFDLALTKTLNSGTVMPIVPGGTVTFDLEVFNQGTLDAYSVQLSDYVPEGLTLSDSDWVMVGDTARLVSPLTRVDAGESEIVMISFTVDSDYMLTSIQNNSEIESQEDINGPRDDDDSEAGDEDGSLPDTEDNDVDETNGDDDYDPEVITIMQTFDLALTKTLNIGTVMPIVSGGTVTFDLEVFNQGTLDAYNIQLSDYVPEGLSLSDGNWVMVGDTARLVSPLTRVDAGESEIVMISFTVDSDYMLTSIQNNSEIESQEDINGPRDDDDSEAGDEDGSLPDTEDNDVDETNGDDDYDPEVITIMQTFDLALTKTLNIGTVMPIVPGGTVTFDLEVFNQGTLDAYNIQLSDYVPEGLSLSDGNWVMVGDTARLVSPLTRVDAGESEIVMISFTVDSDYMLTSIQNNSEIESQEDINGPRDDDDSESGNEDGSDPDTEDNDIDETNGDDDYDPEVITIMQTFDLALTKTLNSGTVMPIVPSGTVTFDLEVFNQGTLDAYNIQLSDYVPQGLTLSDSDWVMVGDTARLVSPLTRVDAGESEIVMISFTVDSDYMLTSIQNNSEIESQEDINGPRDDDDSEAGDEDGSDPDTEDNDIDETNGDDDYDPEVIMIMQTFDLALTKTLNSGTVMPIVPGGTVIFDLEVFNQGTLDAYNIQLSDYVPEGLTLSDGNWVMVGDTARLVSPLARVDAGESEIVMISFTVDSDYMLTSIQNNSEIESQEDINGPRDDDDSEAGDEDGSDPDTEDNDIDETNGDDDYDPEVIMIMQTFDLALTKTLNSGTAMPIVPGGTVTFDLEVFNQGTLDAYNVQLSDYVPEGLSLSDGNWVMVGDTARLVSPLARVDAGESEIVMISFTVDSDYMLTSIQNNSEIESQEDINGPRDDDDSDSGDEDGSDPDAEDNDIDETNGDDDYDPEVITIMQDFDLALTKTLNSGTAMPIIPGGIVTYDLEVFNQGTLDAYNIQLSDYVPDGLMLSDGNWVMVGDTARLVSPLARVDAGESEIVMISFTVDSDFRGMSITNNSEIESGEDINGPRDDSDSESGNEDGSTSDDDDNNITESNGDDDYDPETINLCHPEVIACPDWGIVTYTIDGGNCIAPAYSSLDEVLAIENMDVNICGNTNLIDVSYSDALVPEECTGGLSFDKRTVFRTYHFLNAINGDTLESCPQEITYDITSCIQLTNFGTIDLGDGPVLEIPSGCDAPEIKVLENESGVCGYVEYMWLVSTFEDGLGNPYPANDFTIGTIWQLIPGATDATYDPGILSENTHYVRCARNFACCDYGESNIVSFRINAGASCPIPSVGVEILQDCDNVINLLSPIDDYNNGEKVIHISNQMINAENTINSGADIILDGKVGTTMHPGFEVKPGAIFEVKLDGCNN